MRISSISTPICLALLFLASSMFVSCGKRPPLIALEADNTPVLIDLGDRDSLIKVILQQIKYLESLPPNEKSIVNDKVYTNDWYLKSAKTFLSIIQHKYPDEFQARLIAEHFNIYQATGRKGHPLKEMLVTGYHEPMLEGSLTKSPPFLYPLYAIPPDLVERNIDNKKQIFRLSKKGKLEPYWTREVIDELHILTGNELVYLKDPIDAFSIHVQGSGKIRLRDNTIKSIRYAGSNGRTYNSIGKLLVDEGIMTLEEVTMPKIRQYLIENPTEMKRVLYHNQKYIFFSWAPTNKPPRGSSGVSLTAGRSIAIDPATFPPQALGFIKTRRPIVDANDHISEWDSFNQFVMPQDSGSAIKGAGRVDIFWGNNNYAKIAAGNMKESGELFFLVKKAKASPYDPFNEK